MVPGVVPQHALRQTPPVNRMTNRCKNITLPQTSFAVGNRATICGATKLLLLVITARQRSCGKVMFSVESVHPSDILSIDGSHVSIIHDALDLTIQGPLLVLAPRTGILPQPQLQDMGPCCTRTSCW